MEAVTYFLAKLTLFLSIYKDRIAKENEENSRQGGNVGGKASRSTQIRHCVFAVSRAWASIFITFHLHHFSSSSLLLTVVSHPKCAHLPACQIYLESRRHMYTIGGPLPAHKLQPLLSSTT